MFINRNSNIQYDITKHYDCNISYANTEIQLLEIMARMMKKMLIVNCYRSPSGSVPEFFNDLHNTLDTFNKLDDYELYILGDFNITYHTSSSNFSKLKNFEHKYLVTQLITQPTRCTAQNINILDWIFSNSMHIALATPLEVNLSDHEPVVALRKESPSKTSQTSFQCRTFTNFVKEDQSMIINYDWSVFFDSNTSTDEKCSIMEGAIRDAVD